MLGELKGSSWVQLVRSAREVKVRERKGEEAKAERQQQPLGGRERKISERQVFRKPRRGEVSAGHILLEGD